MNKFLSTMLLSVTWGLTAGDFTPPALTGEQVIAIRQLLQRIADDKNNKELLQNLDCDSITAYFFAATNPIPPKAKLAVGGCLSARGFYSEAIKLMREYRVVASKDWDGIVPLGDALKKTKAYDQAVTVFLDGLKLLNTADQSGDRLEKALNYASLADAALLGGREEALQLAVTNLTAFKSKDYLTEKLKRDAFYAMAAYAIGTRDQRLFLQAAEMADLESLMAYPDARLYTAIACRVFRDRDFQRFARLLGSTADKRISHPNAKEAIAVNADDVESAGQLLKDDEAGTIDLYSMVNPELGHRLMGYYLAGTNSVAPKGKLPISRSFALAGRLEEAIHLAREYVQTFPKDARGWRIIGLGSYKLEQYSEACQALTNAIALGETNMAPVLASCVLQTGQVEIIGGIVPNLLPLRHASGNDQAVAIWALLCYSIVADDADLFVRAIQDVEMDVILEAPQLRVMLLIGHQFFRSKEIESFWLKYEAAQRK